MKRATLNAVRDSLEAGRSIAVVTDLETGRQALVEPQAVCSGDLTLPDETLATVRDAIATDTCMSLDSASGRLFVHVHAPPPRLLIVGAVHIAEPLVAMATLAGYAVTLIDPRRGFAERQPFKGLNVRFDWPDQALTDLKPDARTAIVMLTHDPKLDEPALAVALRSPAFYVGALGSRRTHAARLARLRKLGLSDEELAQIHGPVGLAIGAVTPAEIAISIMAEITQVRRQIPPAKDRILV